MNTSKKAIANKRNAQKSNGPKSTEGLAKSSQNAIRHGATSRVPDKKIGEARELLRLDEAGVRNPIARDKLRRRKPKRSKSLGRGQISSSPYTTGSFQKTQATLRLVYWRKLTTSSMMNCSQTPITSSL
jgi:hypothetical protein